MAVIDIGIIVNGATGRIGSTQHLANALVPIRAEGGLSHGGDRIMPRLLLVGRNAARLKEIAKQCGAERWLTDLDAALAAPGYDVFFDAAATEQRVAALSKAIAAGKHIYTEKPVAPTVAQGRALLAAAQARGLKAGAVEDKMFLPGMQKLAGLARDNFFGRVTGFRLEFGWWVFDGAERASQRPSWNYRSSGGGGLTLDMYPHWRYLIESLLGPIRRVASAKTTAQPQRVDEQGKRFAVDVDDSAVTLVELAKRRARHHRLLLGDARAPRRPGDPADRRQRRIGGRRAAPLLGAERSRHAGHPPFQRQRRYRRRLPRRLARGSGGRALHQSLPGRLGALPAPCGRRCAARERPCRRHPRRGAGRGLRAERGARALGGARGSRGRIGTAAGARPFTRLPAPGDNRPQRGCRTQVILPVSACGTNASVRVDV